MMTENEAWEEVKRRLYSGLTGSICPTIDQLYYNVQINLELRKQLEKRIRLYRETYKIDSLFLYSDTPEGLQRRLELIDSFIGGYDVPYKGYDE